MTASSDQASYSNYLQSRSQKAWIYRKLFLYPRLARHLNGRVIDVGCGIGDFLSFYRDAVGIDVNPENIAYCRSRGLDTHPLVGPRYPFADGVFDGAVLDNVLEHLEDPAPTLTEITRVLRDQGALIIGVPAEAGFAADPDHKVHYSENDLVRCIESYGYSTVDTFHAPFRSEFLASRLPQYCVYGIFKNMKGPT